MSRQPSDHRVEAERLLGEHRFEEAAARFTEHLGRHPDDTRALLELGICHLLNRSESGFLAVHARASERLGGTKELPGELARLWSYYRSLAAKLGAAALAATAAVGCETSPAQAPDLQADTATAAPAATESATVASVETAAATAEPTAVAPAATTPTAPAGTTAAAPPPATTPSATSTASFASPPPPSTTTTPAHRYSGGVYVPTVPTKTTPAHRYSGGVRN